MTTELFFTLMPVVLLIIAVEFMVKKTPTHMCRVFMRMIAYFVAVVFLMIVLFDLSRSLPTLTMALPLIGLAACIALQVAGVNWLARSTNRVGRQAFQLADEGCVEDAIDLLKTQLRGQPLDAYTLANIASLYEQLEQFEEAFDTIDRAIALNSEESCFPCVKANLLLKRGDPAAAHDLLHNAVDRWPDSSPLQTAMAEALFELGQSEAALDAIGRAEELLDSGRVVGVVDPSDWQKKVDLLRKKIEKKGSAGFHQGEP